MRSLATCPDRGHPIIVGGEVGFGHPIIVGGEVGFFWLLVLVVLTIALKNPGPHMFLCKGSVYGI